MRDYELVLVVKPDGGDEGFTATVERFSQFIKDQGGEITKVDPWGIRKLAYPINRHMEGFYSVTSFKMEPTEVRVLEDSVGRSEDVLRHIVTRQDGPPPPAETPPVSAEPAKAETPVATEAAPASEEPAKAETPVATEAAPASGASAKAEMPVATEAAPASEASVETEAPAAAEAAPASEAPAETETPVVAEAAPASEAPAEVKAPVADEVSVAGDTPTEAKVAAAPEEETGDVGA